MHLKYQKPGQRHVCAFFFLPLKLLYFLPLPWLVWRAVWTVWAWRRHVIDCSICSRSSYKLQLRTWELAELESWFPHLKKRNFFAYLKNTKATPRKLKWTVSCWGTQLIESPAPRILVPFSKRVQMSIGEDWRQGCRDFNWNMPSYVSFNDIWPTYLHAKFVTNYCRTVTPSNCCPRCFKVIWTLQLLLITH